MASKPEPASDSGFNTNGKSFEELCTKVKDLVPEAVGTETWYLIIVRGSRLFLLFLHLNLFSSHFCVAFPLYMSQVSARSTHPSNPQASFASTTATSHSLTQTPGRCADRLAQPLFHRGLLHPPHDPRIRHTLQRAKQPTSPQHTAERCAL
jgi:hypothetical protein